MQSPTLRIVLWSCVPLAFSFYTITPKPYQFPQIYENLVFRIDQYRMSVIDRDR